MAGAASALRPAPRRSRSVTLAGERRRGRDGRERGNGPPRDLHPPSALIAITSAVPSPAIMNPTRQLP